MGRFLRSRLTFANVMAGIAVFLALAGGAYAATSLPSNSVGTRQIKNGAVTPAKLSKSAKKQLKGQKGARGAQGLQGATGAPGAPGATKVIVRKGPFAEGRSVASCLTGEVATGGGGWVEPEEPEAWIWNTLPVQESGEVPTSWEAQAANKSDEAAFVQAYVICASP